MMVSSRLPLELYRGILEHIPDRQDICSFSLASHSLHNEAEPFLWRKVTIDLVVVGYRSETLDHINTNPRVAQYLHSLTVRIKDQATAGPLQAAFQSTSNLKSLDISGPLYSRLSLGYLIENPTFKLHRLSSDLPISSSCQRFFSTQDKLVDFDWTIVNAPTDFFSTTDLPSLTYFTSLSRGTNFLDSLLLGRNITHLWCPYRGNLSGSYESVRVLASSANESRSDLWITFPNLRHIILHHTPKGTLLEIVKNLNHLKSASIFLPPGINSYSSSAMLVNEIYACDPKLEWVEVMFGHYEERCFKRWKFEKTCDLTMPAPPCLSLPGRDEWKRW